MRLALLPFGVLTRLVLVAVDGFEDDHGVASLERAAVGEKSLGLICFRIAMVYAAEVFGEEHVTHGVRSFAVEIAHAATKRVDGSGAFDAPLLVVRRKGLFRDEPAQLPPDAETQTSQR